MRLPILVASGVALAACALVVQLGGEEFVLVYRDKLQVPMFAGFLTLAGFILSLKTNILLRLHADLFNKEEYLEWVESAEALEGKPVSRYGPLINLGNFLIWTVLCSIICSVLQMTIGFIYEPWSTAVCLGTAAAAMTFTLWAWTAIRANLQRWFEIIEATEMKRREGKSKQADRPL